MEKFGDSGQPPAIVSVHDYNETVEKQVGLDRCWKVNRFLGSMFTMDFGKKIQVPVRRGFTDIGSTTISIRDCYWALWVNSREVLNSELAGSETDHLLKECLSGRQWRGVKDAQSIILDFDNDTQIEIEYTPELGSKEYPVETIFPNGCVFQIVSAGRILRTGEVSLNRSRF